MRQTPACEAFRHCLAVAERRFLRTGVALLALLAATLAPAAADQPAAGRAAGESKSADLQFRRVFVPEDQLDQWPRHGERYLPMDATDFERRVSHLQPAAMSADASASTQGSTRPSTTPPSAEVVHAVYEARLTGDVLSDGHATLQIRHAGKLPALMRMDSCRLPIQSPRWIGGDSSTEIPPAESSTSDVAPLAPSGAADTAHQPAILGVGAEEKLVLRVEKSGRLQFDWSLIGRRETGATLVFDLGLPSAPSNELRLTLPADLAPSVEQGFVKLLADDPSQEVDAALGSAAHPNKHDLRHWEIELGSQTRVVLRLARHDFLREVRPLTLMRQSLIYDFSPRGMQLSADVKLDILGESVQRVALLVDQPLTLVTARYGGTQLPWFETDAAGKRTATTGDSIQHGSAAGARAKRADSDHASSRHIVLELPEPLHGTGRVLRLGFVAPLIARGRLPTLRPADEGLFWQEGSATLLVPLPLELDELTLHGCRQTKAEPLPAPLTGESIALQYFRPDADVDVALARRDERLQSQSGTMIDVRGSTMTGRCLADITAQDGEWFELLADVSPSWIIDSVETVPADSLADWNYATDKGPAARLDIALAKSIRPDRPLRLLISGRWRQAPRGGELRLKDLQMATLRGVAMPRRVEAIHAAAPYRLQIAGAERLHRLDPARLAKRDAALLGGAPIAEGTLAMIDDDAAKDLTVKLINETPRFSGTVHLDAQVADASLVESYGFHCKPESAELDRLLIHFSRRREEPLRWNLVTSDNQGTTENVPIANGPLTSGAEGQDQLSARRLSAAEQASLGIVTGGEVWELTFRQPGGRPLEIRAIRNSALTTETPLALAAFVQATEQQGSVGVWATGRRSPQINNRRLKPIPIGPAAVDSPSWATDSKSRATDLPPRAGTELAAFQYDPVDEIAWAAGDSAASLAVSPGTERPRAWAWSCRLESYFSPDGSSQHLGCWRIENTGRTRVRFQMPPGATFDCAWIDDALCPDAAWSTASALAGAVSIDRTAAGGNRAKVAEEQIGTDASVKLELPAGRRFVRVVLQWSSDDKPLSLLSSRKSQLPNIDMPVMAGQWHVWLPPRFRLICPDADCRMALTAPISWSQRLLGPFGKPADETAFNPLRRNEWAAMLHHLTGHDADSAQAQQFVNRLTQRASSALPTPGSVLPKTAKKDAALTTAPSLPPPAAQSDNAITAKWGELLAAAHLDTAQASDVPPLPLLVDAQALADIGMSPRSPIRSPGPDAENGWPLAQADLVLLVDPRAMVLTSRSAAAVWGGPWSAPERLIRRAPPGRLDEELQRAIAGNSERFVPVEAWSFPEIKSPWAGGSFGGDAPAIDHPGWAVYDLELSDGPRQVGIVDRDMMSAVGLGLFLVTLTLTIARGDVSWKYRGVALTSATAVALSIPASCAALGAGLWMGLAVGWILRTCARRNGPLGAFSHRLFAAIAETGTAPRTSDVSSTSQPASEAGDVTLPSTPIESVDSAAHGDSQSHRGAAMPSTTENSSVRKQGGPAGGTLGFLLVLACLAWHDAGAAEPAGGGAQAASRETERPNPPVNNGAGGSEKAEADRAISEVLIPTDDRQRPQGKIYLVPEKLYRELIRRGDPSADRVPPNWLITTATYRGGLSHHEKSAGLDTTDWSATYDLVVLSPSPHVWIPLGASGAHLLPVNLLPDGVRLDGRPIQFQWESRDQGGVESQGTGGAADARRGVGFDGGAVGSHKVELSFRPMPQEQAGATSLDFAILPLATSRLELSVPSDVPIDVPGARGQASLDRAHGRLTEPLGPIDQLSLRSLSDAAGGVAKPPVFDVEESYWLKVRPGSVVLETRFNVRVAEGKLAQLRLLEDPRLRRLPLEAGSPISEVRTEEGDPHTIYVGLAQPVIDRTSFKLSFLLTDTSGIGNLRLPKLEPIGARSETRQLAVSVESPLEFDPPSAAATVGAHGAAAEPAAAPLTAAQFLATWGAADAKPQLAYKLPPGEIRWTLPIHSRQPRLESREQFAVAIDRSRLHETWLSDLTVQAGTVFQIQVSSSPQWAVEKAVLRQDGVADQTIRCARAPGGAFALFLPGPAPEHFQLLLRGSMPCVPGKEMALPELRITGPSLAKVASQSILLLRASDVQIKVANLAGMKPSAHDVLQADVDRALAGGLLDRAALGHLRPAVALSRQGASGARPTIRISLNAPGVEGKEWTTVERVGDLWRASVDLDFDVSGGMLDELRLDLPPQWTHVSTITPATPNELIDVPGENHRQLVFRPAEPWTGAVRLHLKGSIVVPQGQRVRVPEVRPLGLPKLHRYLRLPTRSGEQNLSWETSGLNFEHLPKRFSPDSSEIDLYRICEVVADHFEATLKSVEKTIGQPRVRLADIAVACSDSGHCFGTATFDLEPAGALSCLLELAPNEQLIHVRADGVAAEPRPVGENHWSVALGDGKLPQRLEIVFTADLSSDPPGKRESQLSAPVLVGLPVERTLWSVARAKNDNPVGSRSGGGATVAGAAPATCIQQSLIRLETISRLLESAGSAPDTVTDEPIAGWLAPWPHRLLVARGAVDQCRAREGPTDMGRTADAAIRAVDLRQAKLIHRLGIGKSIAEPSASRAVADDAFDLWNQVDGVPRTVAGYDIRDFGPTLALEQPSRGLGELGQRILTAIMGTLALGLLFWLVWRASQRPALWSSILRRPSVLGVVAGLFWWLQMEPSWLGLAIVAISAVWMLRSRQFLGKKPNRLRSAASEH